MAVTWLLLIYTIPSEPSRKRAFIWRELKKSGAVYLRDGVCALPDRTETAVALRAIAAKIEEFGGQATLIEGAHLDRGRTDGLIEELRAARAKEYEELRHEAEQFLAHVRRETEHRAFSFAELAELEGDLTKLKRWADQVRARAWFDAGEADRVAAVLAGCEEALVPFKESAARQDEGAP